VSVQAFSQLVMPRVGLLVVRGGRGLGGAHLRGHVGQAAWGRGGSRKLIAAPCCCAGSSRSDRVQQEQGRASSPRGPEEHPRPRPHGHPSPPPRAPLTDHVAARVHSLVSEAGQLRREVHERLLQRAQVVARQRAHGQVKHLAHVRGALRGGRGAQARGGVSSLCAACAWTGLASQRASRRSAWGQGAWLAAQAVICRRLRARVCSGVREWDRPSSGVG